jgi:hypothetical protein
MKDVSMTMPKNSQFLHQWLNPSIDKSPRSLERGPSLETSLNDKAHAPWKNRFPTFSKISSTEKLTLEHNRTFHPGLFLTPGWSGDSLPSKATIAFSTIFDLIQTDIKAHFLTCKDFNRSLKLGIYNEFLAFALFKAVHIDGMEDSQFFWKQVQKEEHELDPFLLEFVNVFAYRCAVILFLKLRFVKTLNKYSGIETHLKNYLNLSSYLAQFFKKGSSLELRSRAFELNIFSWYRPRESVFTKLCEWAELSKNLSISELVKNISPKVQSVSDSKQIYSHTISHLNFGLFLNSLLINFPLWIDTTEVSNQVNQHLLNREIISCKYRGDYLESLALSHWLAQENNKSMKWDQILCPDFKSEDFSCGLYMKIFQELQFMTFLADSAELQNEEPIQYIAQTMGDHFKNRKNVKSQTTNHDLNLFYNSTYDRIVLNIVNPPKNNPIHYIANQIQDQIGFLKENGYLYVLASRDLFIQSQKEKLLVLLKDVELKSIFNLEDIKGKGEIPSRIYIFKKKSNFNVGLSLIQRQAFHHFNISATLETFHQFGETTKLLRDFYLAHVGEIPIIYHSENSSGFQLQFSQKSLVDGHFINTDQNKNHFTHPHFYKTLMENFIPLDSAFELRAITGDDERDLSFIKNNSDDEYGLLVKTSDETIVLDIVSLSQAISENLLKSPHHLLFKLLPKKATISPLVLKHFLNSALGHQLIEMTFVSSQTKIKSQISKLLVPRFFIQEGKSSLSNKDLFLFLGLKSHELSSLDSNELNKRIHYLEQIAPSLFKECHSLFLNDLVIFNKELGSLTKMQIDSSQSFFYHPMMISHMKSLASQALLPNHPDLFVENESSVDLLSNKALIINCQLLVESIESQVFNCLKITTNQNQVIKLHGEKILLEFASLIFQSALNYPLNAILKSIKLPLYKDIQSLYHIKKNQLQLIKEQSLKVQSIIESFFNPQRFL